MQIDDDHMYHGAALIQIAEDPQFTAINALQYKDKLCKVAYRINDSITVYLKYATTPSRTFKEYQFVFTRAQLDELSSIAEHEQHVFLALVCVKGREICGISYGTLLDFIEKRKKAKGAPEAQYTLLVTIPKGKSLRAYMNEPGKRKTILGDPVIIPRKNFPALIFQ